MPQRVILQSSSNKEVLIDEEYGAFPTMTILHYQTHIGQAYEISNIFAAVANGANADLVLDGTTNPTWEFHVESSMAMEGEADIFMYEGPTVTAATGTTLTPRCLNRNILQGKTVADESKLSAISAPTITAVGTELTRQVSPAGTGGQATGSGIGLNERMLKKNTKYLIRITNNSGQARDVGIRIVFYQVEEA